MVAARLVRHDLDGGSVALGHCDAHKPEAHVLKDGLHERGKFGGRAYLAEKALRGGLRDCRVLRVCGWLVLFHALRFAGVSCAG